MSVKMSIDVWLKELNKIYANNEAGGISIDELAARLKIGHTTAQRRMKMLIDTKKWVFMGRKSLTGIDGRRYTCPVYAPIKGKNNDKK